MFLSKAAITKQLFYEFLEFKTLALAPGKPAQLHPGTMLASSTVKDLDLSIEDVEKRLKEGLSQQEITPGVQKQFDTLLSDLVAYKNSTYEKGNPFLKYAEADVSKAHPSAWPVFAPLVIDGTDKLFFPDKESYIAYLNKPRVAFSFDTNCLIDKTGLHIAVKTKNHEMVDAFLTPELYRYSLTIGDLKQLLLLTDDPKTRMALFRHSKDLMNWIGVDKDLQTSCVKSFEELSGLWSYLTVDQRKEFIKNTNSQLWLNLLDKELGRQKIEKLLGPDFALLNEKVKVNTLNHRDSLPKTLKYLEQKQHFEYVLQSDVNKLYPLPRGADWQKLLSSLGYQSTKAGLITTRYVFPEEVAYVHNQLIEVLVSLPVEAKVIIEALQKIEAYVQHPKTEELYKQYQESLNAVAKDAVHKEYETGFFIVNWFNYLLRFLKIKKETPLHPYINWLAGVVKTEPLAVIPGELMSILPPTEDYDVYKGALAAYFKNDIALFWAKLSPKDKEKIVHDPIRFEALVRFLSAPVDKCTEFFKALDADSLKYFNTPEGLRQLILETPSFKAARDLPYLVQAMKEVNIVFLDDVPNVVKLLVNSNEVLQQVKSHLPFKLDDKDSLAIQQSVFDFQQSVLVALKPLEKEHFNRFLDAYCSDAHQFSSLLGKISIDNPVLANTCWDYVLSSVWERWFAESEHAVLWSKTLKTLPITDRLDFFEKLTSGGSLTADEFCDFLLVKNEAVFNTLWDQVPEQQWATWIKDNKLPSTIKSLLNTMEFKLRIQFFKAMLKAPEDLLSICATPGKTVEHYYLEDVKKKMVGVDTPNNAKVKLVSLKDMKRKEFDTGLQDLTKAIEGLNGQLNDISKTDLKGHTGYNLYSIKFFSDDPFFTSLELIKKSHASIETLYKLLSSHPLYPVVKDGPELNNLDTVMKKSREHQEFFRKNSADVPDKLSKELKGIELIFKKIDEVRGLPPVVGSSKVKLEEPAAQMAKH